MKEFISASPAATESIGALLAKDVGAGDCVALFGGLGMGKTAFTRGFAKALKYKGEVASPTFAIVHEYLGGTLPIYHFDMYRIESYDELYSSGYFEYIESEGVSVIEWSENIENVLPKKYYRVEISPLDGDESARKISVSLIENEP